MARVNNIIGKALSGRIGNIVFVNLGGSTYARTLPRERKPSEWSAEQKKHRKCFGVVVKYASSMMVPFIKPIWNKSITNSTSGFNQFVKANKPAFGKNGTVNDPGLLRFSIGPLPLPADLNAILSAEQSNIITISWKNQISDLVRNDDHLMAVFYNVHPLIVPIETGFIRKDEQAKIVIPDNSGKEIYLYLFFKVQTRHCIQLIRCLK